MVNLSVGSSEIVGSQNIVYYHLSIPKTPFLCKRKLKREDVTYIQITYLYNVSSFFWFHVLALFPSGFPLHFFLPRNINCVLGTHWILCNLPKLFMYLWLSIWSCICDCIFLFLCCYTLVPPTTRRPWKLRPSESIFLPPRQAGSPPSLLPGVLCCLTVLYPSAF